MEGDDRLRDKTTQADIDAAADQSLEEHGSDIGKVKANQAAVRIVMSKAKGALPVPAKLVSIQKSPLRVDHN